MGTLTLWLSVILMFIIPWENAVTVSGLGTISKSFGLLLALVWGMKVIVTGEIRKLNIFHLAVFLFLAWNIASIFWSIDPESTTSRVITYSQLTILVMLLWDLYKEKKLVNLALQAYVLGSYVGIYGMLQFYSTIGESLQRTEVANNNINDLAGILTLGIPIAWYLTISNYKDGKLLMRMINLAYILLATWAILVTASRSSVAGVFISFLFILISLSETKFSGKTLILSLLISAVFILPYFIPKQAFERLASTSTEVTDGDMNGRTDIWNKGITAFLERPFIGYGSNTYKSASGTGKSAHNLILSFLVELGFIGFSLFILILVTIIGQVIQKPKLEYQFWNTILMILFITVMTHNWESRKMMWVFFPLMSVKSNAVKSKTDLNLECLEKSS